MRAVEVQAAGEDVGARQTLETELCAVSAAANSAHARLNAAVLHGIEGGVDDVHHRLYLLAHIIILVGKGYLHRACAVLLVEQFANGGGILLALLEAGAGVVAYDIGERGFLHVAVHAEQVVETLILGRALGRFGGWHQGSVLRGHAGGVDHLVLGIAWVDAHARHLYLGRGGVEILELQFAKFAAVHGVGKVATEFLHIEAVRAESDFLVGIEAHADTAVLDFGMRDEVDHCLHDFGDARLVVCAEQRMAVGHDDVLAHVVEQFGKLLRRGHDACRLVEHDVATIVVLDNTRFDILARAVGTGIHMGDEAHGGQRLVGVGRERGIDVCVLVNLHFRKPDTFQFLFQVACQDPLLLRARSGFGIFCRLGVETYVLQKSFYDGHNSVSKRVILVNK